MPDGLAARVAGPSTIFPRGFLWQLPLWYAAALAVLLLTRWPPLWFRAGAAAGLLGAMLTVLAVLRALSLRALTADDTGIWLGLPGSTRRRGHYRRATRYLPWYQVERIRLRQRRGGVRFEIILSASAPASARAVRYPPAERAWRAVLLIIPWWYLRRPTGLLTPLDGPPRYQLTVRGTTLDQLRLALRMLAPPEVAIVVLVPRGRSVSSATSAERAALRQRRQPPHATPGNGRDRPRAGRTGRASRSDRARSWAG